MLTINGLANGKPFLMLLDTGSSISIIDKFIVDNSFANINYKACTEPILRLANRTSMAPVGVITLNISYGNNCVPLNMYIYESLPFYILLGLDFCKISKININFSELMNDGERENLFLALPYNENTVEGTQETNYITVAYDQIISKLSGKWIKVNTIFPIHTESYFEGRSFVQAKIKANFEQHL